MKHRLSILLFLLGTLFSYSQNLNFHSNVKAGKCYTKTFEYDKKFEWLEVDCEELRNSHKISCSAITAEQNRLKLLAYKKKLNNLGYNFTNEEEYSESFISAHHKYLKVQEKAKRKALRLERKKARKSK